MFRVGMVTDISPGWCVTGDLGMVVLEKHGLGASLKVAMERHQGYSLLSSALLWLFSALSMSRWW